MTLPERIDARWIDALTDEQLQKAEKQLNAIFNKQQTAEKTRRGAKYDLMRGPEILTNAWIRWSMVRNAAEARRQRMRVNGG